MELGGEASNCRAKSARKEKQTEFARTKRTATTVRHLTDRGGDDDQAADADPDRHRNGVRRGSWATRQMGKKMYGGPGKRDTQSGGHDTL